MKLEEMEKEIEKLAEIEDYLAKRDWKDFEAVVAGIFERHGFSCEIRRRFKVKNKRFEIDVIAVKGEKLMLIECKRWGRGRYKKYQLKIAAERLKEKAKLYLEKILPAQKEEKRYVRAMNALLLVVTLCEEDLLVHERVIFVPIWKLNSFLLQLDELDLPWIKLTPCS